MKKILAVLLCCAMVLTSCSPQNYGEHSSYAETENGNSKMETEILGAGTGETSAEEAEEGEKETDLTETEEKNNGKYTETDTESRATPTSAESNTAETYAWRKTDSASQAQARIVDEADRFRSSTLNDPELLRYVEDAVYAQLVYELDSDEYFVENVESVYISKEYLDELAYNSQENIFFGYTLSQLEEQFQGTKYVFTLGGNGQTVVQPLEEYDGTLDGVIKNVAIGTGVILLCVTVSTVSGVVGAPAVSMIFAMSAESATSLALSSGMFAGVSAGVVEGIRTKDFEKAIKAAAVSGSEGFKWGAFSGAVTGGTSEAIALKGATLNGLTMNQAAAIQKESKYPLDVIKQFHSMEEYGVYKNAGLYTKMVNGKLALVQDIDLDFVSEVEGKMVTNLERMRLGRAPIDPVTGKSYQLHHIGQKSDATLAVLSQEEHLGNAKILNIIGKKKEVDRGAFNKIREEFWKSFAESIR